MTLDQQKCPIVEKACATGQQHFVGTQTTFCWPTHNILEHCVPAPIRLLGRLRGLANNILLDHLQHFVGLDSLAQNIQLAHQQVHLWSHNIAWGQKCYAGTPPRSSFRHGSGQTTLCLVLEHCVPAPTRLLGRLRGLAKNILLAIQQNALLLTRLLPLANNILLDHPQHFVGLLLDLMDWPRTFN